MKIKPFLIKSLTLFVALFLVDLTPALRAIDAPTLSAPTLVSVTSIPKVNAEGVLDLRLKQLKAVPKAVKDNLEIKTLILKQNMIAELPVWIGGLKNLEELDLAVNHLKALPAEIGLLSNLKRLDLRVNHKDLVLPKEIGQLKSLEVIYLPPSLKYAGSLSPLAGLQSKGLKIYFGGETSEAKREELFSKRVDPIAVKPAKPVKLKMD